MNTMTLFPAPGQSRHGGAKEEAKVQRYIAKRQKHIDQYNRKQEKGDKKLYEDVDMVGFFGGEPIIGRVPSGGQQGSSGVAGGIGMGGPVGGATGEPMGGPVGVPISGGAPGGGQPGGRGAGVAGGGTHGMFPTVRGEDDGSIFGSNAGARGGAQLDYSYPSEIFGHRQGPRSNGMGGMGGGGFPGMGNMSRGGRGF